MESMTSAVFPLFRPRFAAAMDARRCADCPPFLFFFLPVEDPWNFNASTGEIFPAIRPGLEQLILTVTKVNIPDNTQIHTDGKTKEVS